MGYLKRFTDTILKDRLNSSGAVLIQGPKGCGKTETALQIAKSTARMDVDDDIRIRMELDPKAVLAGPQIM
jgi:serine kinase of HPr protein (carbohydrate metabolism regulator)